MFAKATKNFVREIDCGGDLIPVSQLNNLDKLQFLNIVTKKKKTWCWQKPKYHLLSVTLNDVLAKDEPIKPGKISYTLPQEIRKYKVQAVNKKVFQIRLQKICPL